MASYLSSVYSVTICSSLKYGDPENYWDFEQSYKLSAFKAVSIMNSVVRIHAYKNLHFLPFFFFLLATKYFRPQLQNPWNHQIIYDQKKWLENMWLG